MFDRYVSTFVTEDETQLFRQGWRPVEPPVADVVLVHGYAEHSTRHDQMGTHLAQHGVALHTYDQRGYGRSPGLRAYIERFDHYIEDLHDFISVVRTERPPDRPFFLMGHSMGGAVALLYALDYKGDLDGLILSSPMLRTNRARFLQWLSALTGRVMPRIKTIAFKGGHLSRDPAVQAASDEDLLNYHGGIRGRTGAELIAATRTVQKRMTELTMPFFVFHGTADRITSHRASKRLYEVAPAEDKTFRSYEGFYHETYNDPGGDQVYADVTKWILDRTPPVASSEKD